MAALGYWTLSTEFLGLVEATCGELVKGDNAWVLVGDASIVENYEELTKWSDHAIGDPILFNFFHGVELMLKGFLSLKGSVPTHHRLSDLHAQFVAEFGDTEFGDLVKSAVVDPDTASPYGQFLQTNGIGVDAWYQALKYPESVKGDEFVHVDLKYGGLETIKFWKGIGEAAHALRVAAVNLALALGEV